MELEYEIKIKELELERLKYREILFKMISEIEKKQCEVEKKIDALKQMI